MTSTFAPGPLGVNDGIQLLSSAQGEDQGQLRPAARAAAIREGPQDGHGLHPGDDRRLPQDRQQQAAPRVPRTRELTSS